MLNPTWQVDVTTGTSMQLPQAMQIETEADCEPVAELTVRVLATETTAPHLENDHLDIVTNMAACKN